MYQTKLSAGLDLASIEDATIRPNQRVLIDTGVYIKDVLPEDIPGTGFAMVCPRSGLAAKYVAVASPSRFGSVAKITSVIAESDKRVISSLILN